MSKTSLARSSSQPSLADLQNLIPDSREIYQSALEYSKSNQEEDLIHAFNLFQQGSNLDHIPSKYKLACCYRDGKGVEQDQERALRIFKITNKSDPKHLPTQLAIARCYLEGKGVHQSKPEAVRRLKLLDSLNYAPAQWQLADYSYENGDKTKAALYYAKVINSNKTELSEEDCARFNSNKHKITLTADDLSGYKNTPLWARQINQIITALTKAKIEGEDEIILGLVKASKERLWPNELAEIYQKLGCEKQREEIIPLIARKIEYCVLGEEGEYPQVKISANDDKTFNVEMLNSPPLFERLKGLIWTMPKNPVADRLKRVSGIQIFPYDDQQEEQVFKILVDGVSNSISPEIKIDAEEIGNMSNLNSPKTVAELSNQLSPTTSVAAKESEALTNRERSRANYMEYKR